MIKLLNAHGFCPWVASHRGHPKHKNVQKNNMENDDKKLSKHKLEYLELSLKINKLRYKGEEPPFELLIQANELGRLAKISDEVLNKLLFG